MAAQQIVNLGPLAGASANLLATSQTPVSGTPLTLTGSQPDVARRILLTYGNEGSARTLKLVGTNQFGNVISETLAVPSGAGGTVASLQDFATVTSALPGGGGWSAAMTLGTNTVASSPWQQINKEIAPVQLSVDVEVTGSVVATAEYTYDDPNNTLGTGPAIARPKTIPTLGSISANSDAMIGGAVTAWRITINSGTGSVQATGTQAGIRN